MEASIDVLLQTIGELEVTKRLQAAEIARLQIALDAKQDDPTPIVQRTADDAN